MLSGLRVKATLRKPEKVVETAQWDFGALALLGYLQQALPGAAESLGGVGTRVSPYQPKTAAQWWGAAKLKGSGTTAKRFPVLDDGKAWFLVGGRYIGVDPTNLYSSDYGTDGRAQVMDAPTYPNLEDQVARWRSASVANTDAKLSAMLRDVVSGKPVPSMPDFLPVLGTVLLVSEVARNHTAFHTNLMAWDLIQHGAAFPTSGGSITWTWQNAIWLKDACPDCGATGTSSCGTCGGVGTLTRACGACAAGIFKPGILCGDCGGTGLFRPRVTCRRCRGTRYSKAPIYCRNCGGTGNLTANCGTCRRSGVVDCRRCKGKGRGTVYDETNQKGLTGSTISGGAENLQNGLLPMSHKGSAFGSAFTLTGEGTYQYIKGGTGDISSAPSPLLVVRRKEASIVIQWLKILLEGSSAELDDGTVITYSTELLSTDLDLSTVDFSKAYDEVEGVALGGTELSEDNVVGTPAEQAKNIARARFSRYLQIRVEYLWYALE